MQDTYQTYTPGRQASLIPIDRISLRQEQAFTGRDSASIRDLAASIRRDGLIQPITVRRQADGHYIVVNGNRRLLACRLCGMEQIEAVVLSGDAQADAVRRLIDELASGQLDELAQAEAIHRLCVQGSMARSTLARRMGCTEQQLDERLSLMQLSEPLRTLLASHRMPVRMAYALLRIPQEEKRMAIARQAIRQALSVADVELLVSSSLRPPVQPRPQPRTITVVRDERLYLNAIRTLISQMQEAGLQAELQEHSLGAELELTIRVPVPRRRRVQRHAHPSAMTALRLH